MERSQSNIGAGSEAAAEGGRCSSHTLSLPLLHRGPVKHVPHACCLLLEELAVLCALLGPGGVKRCGVLVHQVGVFGASGPTKVLDLVEGNKGKRWLRPEG